MMVLLRESKEIEKYASVICILIAQQLFEEKKKKIFWVYFFRFFVASSVLIFAVIFEVFRVFRFLISFVECFCSYFSTSFFIFIRFYLVRILLKASILFQFAYRYFMRMKSFGLVFGTIESKMYLHDIVFFFYSSSCFLFFFRSPSVKCVVVYGNLWIFFLFYFILFCSLLGDDAYRKSIAV